MGRAEYRAWSSLLQTSLSVVSSPPFGNAPSFTFFPTSRAILPNTECSTSVLALAGPSGLKCPPTFLCLWNSVFLTGTSEKLPLVLPASWNSWHPTVGPTVLVLTQERSAPLSWSAQLAPPSHELPSNTLSSCKTKPEPWHACCACPQLCCCFLLLDPGTVSTSLLSL